MNIRRNKITHNEKFGYKMISTSSNGKELYLESKKSSSGFSVVFKKEHFRNEYPNDVWNATPHEIQDFLIDNLLVATTMHLGLIYPEIKRIHYKSSRPLFEPYFNQNFLYDIPSCAEVDELSIPDEVKKFLHLQFDYADHYVKQPETFPVPDAHRALGRELKGL